MTTVFTQNLIQNFIKMKKYFIKFVIKRLKSKTPKIYKVLSLVAGLLIAVFFGADQIYEMCDISEMLCKNKEFIYSILIMLAGGSQFAVEKKGKKS